MQTIGEFRQRVKAIAQPLRPGYALFAEVLRRKAAGRSPHPPAPPPTPNPPPTRAYNKVI
ncbi:MAG: hypothetical protein SNJ81_13350 [Cyanobacteriota bacterium]